MGSANITAHPSAAMDHTYTAAVNASKVEISATPCNFFGFEVENNDTAEVFLQVFNKAAAAVTVGTTAPDFVYRIPASSNFGKDAQNIALDHFSVGMTIAVTAVRGTDATAPGAAASVHVWTKTK